VGGGVDVGAEAFFWVERSHANLELAVEDGVCGFAGAGLRFGDASWAAPVNEGPRLKRLAIMVGSSSSSSSEYSES